MSDYSDSILLEIRALGVLAACAILTALPVFQGTRRPFEWIEAIASKIARHRAICCVGIAALVVVIRVGLLPSWKIPLPRVHDEFAYLFGADTFAAGRLTNPPPKYPQFFEAPHVLTSPSFQSRYPAGQSLTMAAGKVLLGDPWSGVLLSCACMSAAICWMLQGWMPARWALLGGLLSLARLSIYSYWMNSYWGGAVAAVGGCLVMGAYPRIIRQQRFGYAWAMGAGLIILANTRPLEGAISELPVGIALVWWLCRRHRIALRQAILGLAPPLIFSAVLGAALIGYYNYRVTGHVLWMPHLLYARQYQHTPILLVQNLDNREIIYANPDIEYQEMIWGPAMVKEARANYVTDRWKFLKLADRDTLGLLLALPLVMTPLTLRDGRMRLPFVCLLVMLLLFMMESSAQLHYAAPQIGSFFGLLVQTIRHLRAGSRGRWRSVGRFFSRVLPTASLLCFIAFGLFRPPQEPALIDHRPESESVLTAESNGKVIVFVQYRFDPKNVFVFEDWNYNSPDLGNAPVLWVHDMGRAENRKLLYCYPDRTPWHLKIDYSKGPATTPEFSRY